MKILSESHVAAKIELYANVDRMFALTVEIIGMKVDVNMKVLVGIELCCS